MAKLSTVLDQIDAGSMLLPEFQRGYVWNRDQVRGLMRSLYKGYPVGALLVWETEASGQAVRGVAPAAAGSKSMLLDGQQRVTTLYGIIRGRPPEFFDGDPEAFHGLRFNVETENFQFHAPIKMKDDPRWVDVTALFVDGPKASFDVLLAHPDTQARFTEYVDRLQRLRNILDREFYVDAITGVDKTVDVVVDIFNRVNSGGTKLSKGDLALARICADWSEARPLMRRNLDRWADGGFHFTADWLLRNVNAIATGRAPFSALEDVTADEFQTALDRTLHNVDELLRVFAGRLGLDHDRVLMGKGSVPVLTRLLHNNGGQFSSDAERDRALFWYVHAGLRGRFAGASETALAKDLETVDESGIDGVLSSLSRSRKGQMSIDPEDFEGVGRGSRPYPLLYLITRVLDGLDLMTRRGLGQDSANVVVHEIFSKPELAKYGYTRAEVNQIANFAFLTEQSSGQLVGAHPSAYLAECDPEVLRSQWIPTDPQLWEIDKYREFLSARRDLLAAAANGFLEALRDGRFGSEQSLEPITVSEEADEADARAAQIAALVSELAAMGFAQPALDAEITDPDTGRPLAVAEAFWVDGLQSGQGAPLVLELDPEEADIARLTELGCEVFTSVDALRGYVQRRNEIASGDRVDEPSTTQAEADVPAEQAHASGAFDRAVRKTIDRCRTELSYNPRYFKVMVSKYGALGAAQRLVRAPGPSDGFVTLWERDRLDLTVEALVVSEQFAHLFEDAERQAAHRRLDEFGYKFPAA